MAVSPLASESELPFLASGGQMSALITGKDWSGTELGPPVQWPATLRVAVGIVLSSQFPMFLAWGPQLALLYNDAYIPVLGNKHPDALGRPFTQVWHELRPVIEPLISAVLTNEATYQEDLLLVMQRSGSAEETYFTFSCSPILSAEGPPAGLFCACTDTTARVIGERRLRTLRKLGEISAPGVPTAHQALSATLEVLAGNRADVPHATAYLLDDDGSAARLIGSYGLTPGNVALPSALPHPDAEPSIWRVAAGGAAELTTGLSERYASAFLGDAGPAGDDVPDAAMVLPITPAGAEGPVAVLVAAVSPYRELDTDYRTFYELLAAQVSTAVTDALAYQAERARVATLAELDRAKTEFFSNVSHEFRTPLTLMMGPVEQLRASADDPRLRAELDVVHRNGLRLGKLVNTLLDFSRIQAGRIEARYEPVDLPVVTVELASVFRSAMERAGLVFEVDCAQLGEPVYVDREMWEKVVLNLLSNALKFTLDGSITVTLRREESSVVLRVADTGTGIPPAEMPRLFERFHRVEQAQARSMEGSGIGLALVAELVKLHGGNICADSVVGTGTTFTVVVPLGHGHLPAEQVLATRSQADPRPVAAEPFLAEALRWLPDADPQAGGGLERGAGAGVPAGSAAEPGRVLVVDDNADMREYLGRLLSSRHQVRAVGDGRTALDAARASLPDLIISDVMMPKLDGLELVTALRRDPVTAAIPVLLLSARAEQEASVEGLAAGADGYLVKPFSAQELLARVDSHLRLGRARREAERRFRTLADATPALIWVDGPGAQREFVNRSWSAFVGADSSEADRGQRWRERIHPADQERYREVRAAAEEATAPFEVEYRLRRGDGQYRWVLDRGAPLGSPERKEGYVGGCLDIDARHRDQERQRLLAVIGSALDRATTVQARREVLVRTLVAEGLVDLARLIEVGEDGHQIIHAMAANTVRTQRLLAELDSTSTLAREVAASGEPRLVAVDDVYITASSPDPVQQDLRHRLDMRTAALVPLSTRGRVVGLLITARIGSSPAQNSDDLAFLTEIGHRAATALDNALLFEQLKVVQQATAALSTAARPVQVAQTMVTQFRLLLGAPSIAVFELDENDTMYALTLGGWNDAVQRDWRSLPLDAPTPVAVAARHRKPVWLERAADWQRDFPELLPLVQEYGCASLGCLPLVAAGRCLGVVGFGFATEQRFDAAERTAAMALADQSAQALQRAGLLAAESQGRRAAEQLSDVVGALSGATTPAEVARVILGHAAGLGATGAVVVLRSGDHLDVLAATAPSGAEGMSLDAAHPLAHATRTGEPVWHGARSTPAGQDRSLSCDAATGLTVQVAVPLLLGGYPIGAIGLDFADEPPVRSTSERAVIRTVASQCAQALERARLHQAEHEVAETLQRSLLPRELPGLARLDAAARYLPGVAGVQAGGDWYDLLPIGGTRVAIVVGDVVGQGPSAAAVMGQLRSALAGYLLEGHSPAAALEHLDRFATHVDGSQCSTCVCLIMDWDSGELCWSGAGHPPILLLDTGGPRYLDAAASTALGVPDRPPYTEASTIITPGALVLLYTDGLIERRNEIIDDGLGRLAGAAAELTDCAPESFATSVVQRLLGGTAPPDDIALVVVRFIPEPLRARLPAEPTALSELRRTVARWAATASLPAELTQDLQFALSEAAANAVEHAYPDSAGEFDYEVGRLADGSIEVRVQDFGTWRPEPADDGYRGHGLNIIRTLAERVEINSGAAGTEVRFVIPASQHAEPASVSALRAPAGAPAQPAVLSTPDDLTEPRTVQLRGDLDLHGVTTVRNALLAQLTREGEVIVDLRQAGYLSSAGVGLLAEAATTSRHRGIRLCVLVAAGSPAARIITLTGLDDVLPISIDG